MFCSVPSPPTTTAKSKSKWLNNLRSAKGFPDSDHIDLEQFLSTSQTCNSPVKTPTHINHKHHETDNSDSDSYSVNDILSELFHMGEFDNSSSRIRSRRRKKSCRKQHSPKICAVSNNNNNNNNNNVNNNNNNDNDNINVRNNVVSVCKVRVSKPLTLTGRKKVKELKIKVRESVGEEEEERGDWDVAGYSVTEVTVIDTSDPLWKFDKVLYRRNNVWKVRDKRGKGLILSGDNNKRKMSVNENDENVHKKKKKKVKLKPCDSLSKLGDAEENGEIKKKKKKKKKLKLCNSSSYVVKEDDIVGSKSAQKKRKLRTLTNSLDAEEGGEKKRKCLKLCSSSKSVQGQDQGKMMAASFGKKQDK